MAKRYDPILCMMVDEPAKAHDANKYVEQAIKWMKEGKGRLEILSGLQQMGLTSTDAVEYYAEAMTETGYKYRPKDAKAKDELSLAQKKQVVTELKGYLKKSYNFSDESEYARAYEDLRHMFTTGSRKSISGLFENSVKKTGAQDANTLYETFAHGNSKHAGVLEMNGKAKVVVWNEGDNPRTGNVTVIGEDTPANRSKAKSMLDSAKAKDGTYGTVSDYYNQMKGKSKSEVERILASAEGNPNAYLAYKEWKKRYAKAKDSNALDEAIKTCDAVDVDRISNYLWLWVEGREVASLLFNEGLDKYSGPHDKEHKDEAYDFAKKYAQKELDALYSKLKSSVEKKLKEGYTNTKNYISGAR